MPSPDFFKSKRFAAVQRAKIDYAEKPIYIDTETTGTGPIDRIVEIGVIDHDGAVLLSTLVNPLMPIPPGATAVHHITDADVANAPTWAEVWAQLEPILKGRRICIYNAEYDTRMIVQSCKTAGLPVPNLSNSFCAMLLYAQFYGAWNARYGSFKWQTLSAAAEQCSITIENTHRAVDDCQLTRKVMLHMAAGRDQ